jgi:hypothetical protein
VNRSHEAIITRRVRHCQLKNGYGR